MLRFLVLFSLPTVILLSGCSSGTDSSTLNPETSSNLLGSLAGHVRCYDTSPAGIHISLEGTSYTTDADTSGKFYLAAIPGGNYNVVVSKDGFGLCKIFGVAIVSGPNSATIPPVQLARVPPTPTVDSIIIDTLISGGSTYAQLETFNNLGSEFQCEFWVDTDSVILDSKHLFSGAGYLSVDRRIIPKGKKIFITRIYCNRWTYADAEMLSVPEVYYDATKDIDEYISAGPPEIISMSMP